MVSFFEVSPRFTIFDSVHALPLVNMDHGQWCRLLTWPPVEVAQLTAFAFGVSFCWDNLSCAKADSSTTPMDRIRLRILLVVSTFWGSEIGDARFLLLTHMFSWTNPIWVCVSFEWHLCFVKRNHQDPTGASVRGSTKPQNETRAAFHFFLNHRSFQTPIAVFPGCLVVF